MVVEGIRLHADGNDERAEGLSLSSVGVGEWIDGSPQHAKRVEALVDFLADREPSVPNLMTIDWARLANDTLGIGALAFVPRRASLEDTGGAATVEVGVCVGVSVREASRPLEAVHGTGEGNGGMVSLAMLRDGYASVDKLLVQVGRQGERHCRRENTKQSSVMRRSESSEGNLLAI